MNDYISREDVLETLRKANIGGYITDRLLEIPAADVQPVKQWKSVKDRLPDESCGCLGIVDGEVTEVNYSPKSKGYICVWSMCDADGFRPLSDDAVTHWMPLPEPPQD